MKRGWYFFNFLKYEFSEFFYCLIFKVNYKIGYLKVQSSRTISLGWYGAYRKSKYDRQIT